MIIIVLELKIHGDRIKNPTIKIVLFSFIIGVLLLSLFNNFSYNAKAAQFCSPLNLDVTEQEVQVGPGDNGIVKFQGTYCPNDDRFNSRPDAVIVKFNVIVDPNWPTTVTPSSLYFTEDEFSLEKSFEAIVKVPQFTSSKVQGQLTVSCKITMIPGNETFETQPTDGIIIVAPYYMVDAQPMTVTKSVKSGDSKEIKLSIHNQGNTQESFQITVDDLDKLEKKGISITPEYNPVVIPEGKIVNLTICIDIKKGTSDKFETVTISVDSINFTDGNPISASQEVKLYLDIESKSFSNFIKSYPIPFLIFIVVIGIVSLIILKIKEK